MSNETAQPPGQLLEAIERVQRLHDDARNEYEAIEAGKEGELTEREAYAEMQAYSNVLNVLQLLAHGIEPEQGKETPTA